METGEKETAPAKDETLVGKKVLYVSEVTGI